MFKNITNLTIILAISSAMQISFAHAKAYHCPVRGDFTGTKGNYTATIEGVTYLSGYKPTDEADQIIVHKDLSVYYMDCFYTFKGETSGFTANSTNQKVFQNYKNCVINNATSVKTESLYTVYKCHSPGSCEVDCT